MNIEYQGGANFEAFQTDFFKSTLNTISAINPVMIELGSNDCHYSILFNKFFQNECTNICVECSLNLLNLGKENAKNNNCNLIFEHAYVGELDFDYINKFPNIFKDISKNQTSIKSLKDKYNLSKIDMLHMDIQGSEILFIEELACEDVIIEYVFVSTHKESSFGSTHDFVKNKLTSMDYSLLFDNPTQGGYGDGLIVARKNIKE